jgi:hypothetical protein
MSMKKHKSDELTEDHLTSLPPEAVELVLLYAEITDLLSAAHQVPVIATALASDGFWRQKFLQDFDDLVQFVGTGLPGWIESYDPRAPPSRATMPWRRYYYAVRYLMRLLYRHLIHVVLVRQAQHLHTRLGTETRAYSYAGVAPNSTNGIRSIYHGRAWEPQFCSVWDFSAEHLVLDSSYIPGFDGPAPGGSIKPNIVRDCMLAELIWGAYVGNIIFTWHWFHPDLIPFYSWIVRQAPVTRDSKWFDPIRPPLRPKEYFTTVVDSVEDVMQTTHAWKLFAHYADPHPHTAGYHTGWTRLVELGRNGARQGDGRVIIGQYIL